MKGNSKGWGIIILVVAGSLLIAACAVGAQSGSNISVEAAWGRPSPKIATAGAFYMLIKNNGPAADYLVGAKSSACGMAELHESYMNDQGEMAMRPVEGGKIEIPAGGQAELKVGGLHVMCMHKSQEFAPGAKFSVTLTFEKAGDQTIEVEIKDQ